MCDREAYHCDADGGKVWQKGPLKPGSGLQSSKIVAARLEIARACGMAGKGILSLISGRLSGRRAKDEEVQ